MITLQKRFLRHVDFEPHDGCWLWTGRKKGPAYGGFLYQGKKQMAHRVSWQLYRGKIPDGMKICHECDVPLCVNPQHLFCGTQKDNMQDCARKGRLCLTSLDIWRANKRGMPL